MELPTLFLHATWEQISAGLFVAEDPNRNSDWAVTRQLLDLDTHDPLKQRPSSLTPNGDVEGQMVPGDENRSVGHSPDRPVQYSTKSHDDDTAERHTLLESKNLPSGPQHTSAGSHSMQACERVQSELQHVVLINTPGSQSSPESTIPFPHAPFKYPSTPGSVSKHVGIEGNTGTP
mmetsp:Transcript_4358/g.6610  ORF Transcript_4358/g.6610 Transcript_4358/m.6610 type:complete len:176 (+) Transcript_4358:577-1104(+)